MSERKWQDFDPNLPKEKISVLRYFESRIIVLFFSDYMWE